MNRLTLDEIRALPAVVNLWPEAASVLGCSRSVMYDLAARDALPFPVMRCGRRLLVGTPHLLRAVGLEPINDETPARMGAEAGASVATP
jgi:hypothetical protein